MPVWPRTTYIANSLPAIKAADLNAIQTALGVITPIGQSVRTNTPQLLITDALGNVRNVYDHNGYKMGRVSEGQEEWDFVINDSGLGANRLVGHGTDNLALHWAASTGAGSILGNRAPTNTYWAPSMLMHPAAEYMNLYSSYYKFFAGDNIDFVIEFEVMMTTLSSSFTFVRFGFTNASNNFGGASVAESYFYFSNPATLWQVATNSSTGGGGTFSSAIASHGPTANAWQRFRLEYHGKNTPYGIVANPDGASTGAANAAKIRAFIDDVWVYTTSTTVPNNAQRIMFDVTGTASGDTLNVGPVRWAFNRWLSIPAL